jgi:hypothetical protein
MAPRPADPSSALLSSQDVLSFYHKRYVIVVPIEFSEKSEALSNLQARAIDAGAVCSVSCCTRVHVFAGSFGVPRGTYVQINLPPTAREKVAYDSIGYPLCLIEHKGFVVAGMLWTFLPTCVQFPQDNRSIPGSYCKLQSFLEKVI